MNPNKVKAKNLRAMISSNANKKEVVVNNCRESVDKEQEVSFNITPEEEELKKQIMLMNANNDKRNPTLYTDEDPFNYESKIKRINNKGLESEMSAKVNIINKKVKNEAKELIEKTKKIIDNLDTNKSNNLKNTGMSNRSFNNWHLNCESDNKTLNTLNNQNSKDNKLDDFEEETIHSNNINTNIPKRETNNNNNANEDQDILQEDSTIKEPKIKKNNDLGEEIVLKSITS